MDESNKLTRNLFMDTMPERVGEVEALMAKISFQTAIDRPAFHLEGTAFDGQGLVVFTPHTFRQIWLIAYMAWHCMHEQSGFIVGFLVQRRPYDLTAPDVGDAGMKAAKRTTELGESLRRLREAETENAEWPAGVPIPNPPEKFEDVEDQAAFELACFAAAFVMLHESFHALQRIAGVEYGGRDEELACDAYAAHMILDKAGEYATSMGYDESEQRIVLDKRAIGTFLGLVLILESTEIGLREPTESHPAWTERLRAIVTILDPLVSQDGHFWVFATSVMLSRLRRELIETGVIPYENARDLFFKCTERYADA